MVTTRWQIILRGPNGTEMQLNPIGDGLLEKVLDKYPDLSACAVINAGLALLIMKGQRQD